MPRTEAENITRRQALGKMGLFASGVGVVAGAGSAVAGFVEHEVAGMQVQNQVNNFMGEISGVDLHEAKFAAHAVEQKIADGKELTEAELAAKPALDTLTQVLERAEEVSAEKWEEIDNQEIFGIRRVTLRRIALIGGGAVLITSALTGVASFNSWLDSTDEKEHIH
jgi:hypothetical protein